MSMDDLLVNFDAEAAAITTVSVDERFENATSDELLVSRNFSRFDGFEARRWATWSSLRLERQKLQKVDYDYKLSPRDGTRATICNFCVRFAQLSVKDLCSQLSPPRYNQGKYLRIHHHGDRTVVCCQITLHNR